MVEYNNDPVFKWVVFILGNLAGLILGRITFVDQFFDERPMSDVLFIIAPAVLGICYLIAVIVLKQRANKEIK